MNMVEKIGRTLAHPLQQRTANQTMPAINDEEGSKTTASNLTPSADPSIADALEKVGSGWTGDEGKQKIVKTRLKDLDHKRRLYLLWVLGIKMGIRMSFVVEYWPLFTVVQ